MQTLFINDNVRVTLYEDNKSIVFADLKDEYNQTTGYTKKKRGLERVAAFITQLSQDERLCDDVNFKDILNILEKANLSPRTYCAMD